MPRTIVVTGAASGMGKAAADLIAARGERVIRTDFKDGDIAADLRTREGRDTLVAGVRRIAGDAVDAVITCAGLGAPRAATLAVNYFGTVDVLEGLRPLLEKSPSPRAVVISSRMSISGFEDHALVEHCLAGNEALAMARATELEARAQRQKEDPLVGNGPGSAIYASSKVAVARWVRRRSLAADWAGRGILLNAVAPGVIETPMTQGALADADNRRRLDYMHPVAIGRYGRADEVAELYAWLASPANSLLVGQCIFIDGGTEVLERGDRIW
ncbi:MAG: SDR family oxidoreductase [Gammaproteobacteria bacterium]